MSDDGPANESNVGARPTGAAGNQRHQQAEKALWDADALLRERQPSITPDVQTSGMSLKAGTAVQKGEPSRTALHVAQLRAVHQLLDDPIVLTDPVALPILGPRMEASLREDPFRLNDPISRGVRAGLVARSRFAEDELSKAVDDGIRQYVILGAGLDTFAYRNPHENAGLNVFEVDHPSTQQSKRQCLSDAGIAVPATVHFVPVDFEHGSLSGQLENAGLRSDLPTCFSWMGVSVYLSQQAVLDTLSYVAAQPSGSRISFDYRVPMSLLNPIERVIVGIMDQQVAASGEPWISSFDPALMQHQLRELGFSFIDDPGPDAINSRYFSRRKDALSCGSVFRFVSARV